ncbi:MAG TPA: SPFH domain-containing protein, partial [Steroidobacteraceae bacterium]|nr:SPFH domain-containing protein [Steroidobacteraceae bacterium]
MAFGSPILRNVGGGNGSVKLPIGNILMWLAIAVIAIVVVSIAGCGIKVVDTGHRGIKTRFGEVVSESLPEGFYWFNPLTSAVVEMDTRVQRTDSETDTYTRDVQQAAIRYTLNYRLQQNAAHLMYRDIGRDWEQ